jgi:hypothetical protein
MFENDAMTKYIFGCAKPFMKKKKEIRKHISN